MYSPKLGRFVNRDPFVQTTIKPTGGDGYLDGFSLYSSYFSPLGLDPSGLKECCKPNASKDNCLFITTFTASNNPSNSMFAGHSAFGISPNNMYGFHGHGYQKDVKPDGTGSMSKDTVKSTYKCCCLTPEEMDELKKKIEQVQDKIDRQDPTDLSGQTFDVTSPHLPTDVGGMFDPTGAAAAVNLLFGIYPKTNPWRTGKLPYPYCAGSAADFGHGLGCGPIGRPQGSTPYKLESSLDSNPYCEKQ